MSPGDNGGRAKLQRFKREVESMLALEAVVEPTEVLEHLSRMKGQDLLSELPSGSVSRVKRAFVPEMQRAVRDVVRQHRSPRTLLAAYRKGAEAYLTELHRLASRGAWGRPAPATVERKRRDRSRFPGVWGVRRGWLRQALRKGVVMRRKGGRR